MLKEDASVPAGLTEGSVSAIIRHTFRQIALSGLVRSPSGPAVMDDDADDVKVLLKDKQNRFVPVL